MQTDRHGQPVVEFRREQNQKKALIGLLGLCEGLTADQRLTASELACLTSWLADHESILKNDRDAEDLKWHLKDIFADGIVTDAELEDTCSLISCIVEARTNGYQYDADDAVQYLLAMVHGILADTRLNEREVRHLATWLRRTSNARDKWPANLLAERVELILEDNLITADELTNLMNVLTTIAGGTFEENGTITGVVTAAYELEDCGSPIEISGRTFVMTGAFLSGSRKSCHERITSQGGLVANTITQKVDYLVVGIQASRDWINSSHGRKMQQAAAMRSNGHHIRTVSEQTWLRFLK